jgi:hypothetical protein
MRSFEVRRGESSEDRHSTRAGIGNELAVGYERLRSTLLEHGEDNLGCENHTEELIDVSAYVEEQKNT